MDEHDWLAERFEENRAHLRAVAYRMLGSLSVCRCGCHASGRPPRSHRPGFTCHRYDSLQRRTVTNG